MRKIYTATELMLDRQLKEIVDGFSGPQGITIEINKAIALVAPEPISGDRYSLIVEIVGGNPQIKLAKL